MTITAHVQKGKTMRLIDADAVKYEPLPKGERNYRTYNLDDAYDDGYDDAMFDINHMPTVEAEPVRHGKWIRWRDLNGIKRCKCSECIVSYGNMDTPYCPNCGAKMDGERKEE